MTVCLGVPTTNALDDSARLTNIWQYLIGREPVVPTGILCEQIEAARQKHRVLIRET